MEVKDVRFEMHGKKIDLFGTNNKIFDKNRIVGGI